MRVPGETGAAVTAERRATGVPVQAHTWDRLAALADRLGVAMPGPLSPR